ncbi:MAG TPA: S53 family peptidase [Solirubrobacteraceae bacterium]|nr:S53 family peptidase [Solirubrobacteraceae bacterium]
MSKRSRLFCAASCAAIGVLLATCSGALALSGAAPVLSKGSTALGPAEGEQSVVLTLAPRRSGALQALAGAGTGGLTPAAFMSSYAPTTATVQAISTWAAKSGLKVSSVSADRLLVRVTGPAAALGSALGTTFERYAAAGGDYVSTSATAALPAAIAGKVTAVTGLSSLERVHGSLERPSATELPELPGAVEYPRSYDPQQLWSLYHAPASQAGAGQQVSVITAGNIAGVESDLRTFEHAFSLPEVPWHQIEVGSPGTETEGDDEWDLDTQYSTGMAPSVSALNVYVGSSMEDSSILETIDRWVTDDATPQASFSAGECELLSDAAGFSSSLDTVLAEAVAEGRTLFTSSGDTGSQCPVLVGENGLPLGAPGVDYPASSPYAIGVGGTSVLGGEEEIGWYSGGGGTSLIESVPPWQEGAGGSFVALRRGVPDVAFDADPNSGVVVVIDGSQETIGGTSVGAPAWQGVWARVEGAHGGTVPFAGPTIYGEPEGAFKDVVLGDNTLYPCTPGWDYVTGRGSPRIEALIAGG